MCLLVCVVDHGVNEGEPVDEQYREQVNEDQFHDPEPEGQHLVEFLKDKFRQDGWHFCVNCQMVCSYLCG